MSVVRLGEVAADDVTLQRPHRCHAQLVAAAVRERQAMT